MHDAMPQMPSMSSTKRSIPGGVAVGRSGTCTLALEDAAGCGEGDESRQYVASVTSRWCEHHNNRIQAVSSNRARVVVCAPASRGGLRLGEGQRAVAEAACLAARICRDGDDLEFLIELCLRWRRDLGSREILIDWARSVCRVLDRTSRALVRRLVDRTFARPRAVERGRLPNRRSFLALWPSSRRCSSETALPRLARNGGEPRCARNGTTSASSTCRRPRRLDGKPASCESPANTLEVWSAALTS